MTLPDFLLARIAEDEAQASGGYADSVTGPGPNFAWSSTHPERRAVEAGDVIHMSTDEGFSAAHTVTEEEAEAGECQLTEMPLGVAVMVSIEQQVRP